MKRKFIVTLLTAAMGMSLLAGCGSSPESANNGSTSDNTADTVAKNTDGKNIPELTSEDMKITIWDLNVADPGKSTAEGAAERFMADYPNIKIEYNHVQNETYKQQIVVTMSSGECPDMYMSFGGGPLIEYYESGFCNDISDLYATYDHPEFIDAAISMCTYNDELIAIPTNGFVGCGIFYNKQIFKECGIEKVPATIDELEEVCDVLPENGYVPFSLANGSKWTGSMYYMYLVARHSGNDEFEAAYNQTGSFTSDAFIWAGTKIQEWVEKGYFPEGFNSMNQDDGEDRQLLYDDTCAMMLQGSWSSQSIRDDSEEWYQEHIEAFRFPEDTEAAAQGVPQDIEIGTAIDIAVSFNCWNDDGTVDQDKLNACYVYATQYLNDETYNEEKITLEGKMLNIKGYEDRITDPNDQYFAEIFFAASNVQLWYDQYLPASVTAVHKDCMTELFGLMKTPQEIGEQQDAAMQEALAK